MVLTVSSNVNDSMVLRSQHIHRHDTQPHNVIANSLPALQRASWPQGCYPSL